ASVYQAARRKREEIEAVGGRGSEVAVDIHHEVRRIQGEETDRASRARGYDRSVGEDGAIQRVQCRGSRLRLAGGKGGQKPEEAMWDDGDVEGVSRGIRRSPAPARRYGEGTGGVRGNGRSAEGSIRVSRIQHAAGRQRVEL